MIATFDAPLVDSTRKGFGQFFGCSRCWGWAMCERLGRGMNIVCRGQDKEQLIVELIHTYLLSFWTISYFV
jgi:hypothetical protein